MTGTSLKTLLETQFRETRAVPPPDPDTYYRISKISSFCAREEVLCHKHQITRQETFTVDKMLTFLHGTSLHWGLQNIALPAIGVLYGIWQCTGCGTKYGSVREDEPLSATVVLRPKLCSQPTCVGREGRGEDLFRFVEHAYVNEKYKLTGHPDGFLVIQGASGMGILEAKSAGPKKSAEVRRAPDIGHVIQAQLYMWFSGLKWARVFYWAKSEFGLDALKEHIVERDDETIEQVLAAVTSARSGMKNGVLPDRICLNSTCARAATCFAVKQCFAAPG